jgi:multidrug efflux system membrane fusion protein
MTLDPSPTRAGAPSWPARSRGSSAPRPAGGAAGAHDDVPGHGGGGVRGDGDGDGGGDGLPSPEAAGPHHHRRRRPRRPRRRLLVGTAGAALAGLVTAAAVVARGDGGEEGDDGEPATTEVPVEVRDLVLTDDYEGELGFGEADALAAGRSGVVTAVAAAGATLRQGDVVYRLDLQPTVLLHGEVPAFRDLAAGVDPGADVTQLEQALVELGFGEGVTVDAEFTEATADAVEEWEESLGRADPDGTVSLGDVVFAPTDLRVAQVTAEQGSQVEAGTDVVEATGTAQVVTLALTVDEVAEVEAGTPVTVELPDGTEATGTIAEVATEPSSDDATDAGGGGSTGDEGDGEETYAVTVTLDDPALAGGIDSGTVGVTVERSRTEDATAVPVTALLALTEGGYALQVVDPPPDPALPPCEEATSSPQGCRAPEGYRLVPVEVGTVADDWAEVTGEGIEAGVEVVAPA